MTARKTPDVIDWFGALQASFEQASALRDRPTLGPEARCLCGSTDARGRILFQPVDLTTSDVAVQPLTVASRPCRGCGHYVHRGAQVVVRYYGATTTVRDYYHPGCVEI